MAGGREGAREKIPRGNISHYTYYETARLESPDEIRYGAFRYGAFRYGPFRKSLASFDTIRRVSQGAGWTSEVSVIGGPPLSRERCRGVHT